MKVAILGFGVSGESALVFYQRNKILFAETQLTTLTPEALAAGGKRVNCNSLSYLPTFHFRAHAYNISRELMAEAYASAFLENVQIRAAYPTIPHLYQDFVLFQNRVGNLFYHKLPLAFQYGCFHNVPSSSTG
jgi:hypothetical protein